MTKKLNPIRRAAISAAQGVKDKDIPLEKKIDQATHNAITDPKVRQLDINEEPFETYIQGLIRRILAGGDRLDTNG